MAKRILAPTLMILVMAALLMQLPGMAAERSDALEWFTPIQDVRMIIKDMYVEPIDDEKLQELQKAAIDGMIESLDDPYTTFIPAQRQRDFEKTMGGTYVGIGAEVRMVNGWITIISPMAGSPAIEAGIHAGDEIREIDPDGPDGEMGFKSTRGEPIDESIDRLMGEPGTTVSVRVHREGAPEGATDELVITRRRINVQTVEGVHRVGENWDFYADPERKIAYVRLTQFTGTSFDELRRAMKGLVDNGLRGLVFDLRFNPGGRMDAAIQIADLFVRSGRIVSMKGRAVREAAWDAHAFGTLPDFPMVVMVNGQSASASEIVTGALKDNDRAVVLGTRTFGKGKVQDVQPLESGAGQLKITTAYYYLPSGQNIQRLPDSAQWGVDPTTGFYVPLTNAEYRSLLDVQRELDIISDTNGDGDWADPEWIENRLKDPQLASAMRAIRIRLEKGDWEPTGQLMPENAEVLSDLRDTERQRELLLESLERVDKEIERLKSFASTEEEDADSTTAGPILPLDLPLKGGTVEVRDADGNVIRVFLIQDRDDLAVALTRAHLKALDDTAEKAGEGKTDLNSPQNDDQ